MALNLTVKLHPVALFNIIDTYERRSESAQRVIGTLLGTQEKGCVEVTNCFCVPHIESKEEVAIELDFAKDMNELHRKVNPGEVTVGWYATGNDVTEHSVLIHEYYSRECVQPIHLTIDTSLRDQTMAIKAYISVSFGVPKSTKGTFFTPIPVEHVAYQPEAVGVAVCQKLKHNPKRSVEFGTDLSQISKSSASLLEMIDTVAAYVEKVLNSEIPADPTVGRTLLTLVQKIPKMGPDNFQEMLNSNVRDLLMVVYLSQLTKTQLVLNENLALLSMSALT